MEEEVTPSPEYIKGFNEGYVLTKEAPDLSEKLSSVKSDTERTQGFHDGRKQFVLEKAKEQRPSWLTGKVQSKDDMGKDRDKGIDLER